MQSAGADWSGAITRRRAPFERTGRVGVVGQQQAQLISNSDSEGSAIEMVSGQS
jgi:hypothetical protein